MMPSNFEGVFKIFAIRHWYNTFENDAARVGFEPTKPEGLPALKAGSLNLLDTQPFISL